MSSQLSLHMEYWGWTCGQAIRSAISLSPQILSFSLGFFFFLFLTTFLSYLSSYICFFSAQSAHKCGHFAHIRGSGGSDPAEASDARGLCALRHFCLRVSVSATRSLSRFRSCSRDTHTEVQGRRRGRVGCGLTTVRENKCLYINTHTHVKPDTFRCICAFLCHFHCFTCC